MGFTHYSQYAIDLAATLRAHMSGETDEQEALDVLVSKVGEQVPVVSKDDVRGGLLKLADDILIKAGTVRDVDTAVKAMDRGALTDSLAAMVQSGKWDAIQRGERKSWER